MDIITNLNLAILHYLPAEPLYNAIREEALKGLLKDVKDYNLQDSAKDMFLKACQSLADKEGGGFISALTEEEQENLGLKGDK